MWYLYLDESGDLGFDFVNRKPSRYFTITILVMRSNIADRKMSQAVKKTIRKINSRGKRKRMSQELKGSASIFKIKKSFYARVQNVPFQLYAMTLDKKSIFLHQQKRDKNAIYNAIASIVIDQIPLEEIQGTLYFIIDRSKSQYEIKEFNQSIEAQLKKRVGSSVTLEMYHELSHAAPGLQAVDLFCWGVFQKYERKNREWYRLFEEKIEYDGLLQMKVNKNTPFGARA